MRKRKLQPYQVILVRQMHKEGFPRKFISELFGISITSIYFITSFATYQEIK